MLILRLSSVNHMLSSVNHMLISLNRTYIYLALYRNTQVKLMVTHSLTLTDKHPYSWLIPLTLMSYLRRSFFLICQMYDIQRTFLGFAFGFAWVMGYGLWVSAIVLLAALPGLCFWLCFWLCLGYGLVLFLSVQGRKVLRNV